MIISLDHGFVFVKGIKVGGTSVEHYLSQVLGEAAIVAPANFGNPAFRPRNYQGGAAGADLTNHASAMEARAFLGAERFEAMRRALIIRNPYEKIRSFFYFKLGQGMADMTVERAIAGCTSEAIRAVDADGRCLITDVILYERLDADLAAFFASVSVPFEGRLTIFEKAWQRQRYGAIPVIFSPAHRAAIGTKFAFEFDLYARAGFDVEDSGTA